MPGLDHGPAANATFDSPATSARNARVGMVLFVLYLLVYGGFVAINAFWPDVMSDVQIGGVNLPVSYGLGLIGLALVLALIYAWLCRHPAQEPAGSSVRKDSA
jgi:uncharacterized membrane protein (DUF485 family)